MSKRPKQYLITGKEIHNIREKLTKIIESKHLPTAVILSEMLIDSLETLKSIPRKKFKFVFEDRYGMQTVVEEDTERKAFKEAFRSYEVPKDKELRIISKEVLTFKN